MQWTRDFEELTSASTSSPGPTESTPQAFFANAVLILSPIGDDTNAHRQMHRMKPDHGTSKKKGYSTYSYRELSLVPRRQQ
jgi:hypothetical protein